MHYKGFQNCVSWVFAKGGLLTNRRSVQCNITTTVLFLKNMLGVLVLVLVLEMVLGTVPGLLLLL